jgi:hypothetical protein
MAAKPKSNDLWSMKKLTLLSLVGITSIALAHAGWAAGHGGGGGGFGGGGFHGGGFGGHFSSMQGGHTSARGGTVTWGGRNWSGNGRDHHHRLSNDVIFVGDFGLPWWWGDPYGYNGYDYYPYDYYWNGGYGYYDQPGYGYRYGSRSRNVRSLPSR